MNQSAKKASLCPNAKPFRCLIVNTILLTLFMCNLRVAHSEELPNPTALPLVLTPALKDSSTLGMDTSLWKDELSQVAIKEGKPLFFSIPMYASVPDMTYAHPKATQAMEALAWSTNTQWKQIDGVQVFTARDNANYDFQAKTNVVLDWIAALPQEQKVALVYAHLPFNFMDRETQRAFSFAQYDPDFRFVLLDKSSQATLLSTAVVKSP